MTMQQAGHALGTLVADLREALSAARSSDDAARAAARCLQHESPNPGLLSPEQRHGSAEGYAQYVLHVEAQPLFSVVALVWQPGQSTPIHNHRCWGAVRVLQGSETETTYRVCADESGPHLHANRTRRYGVGEVCSFAPPEDIHRVVNSGSQTTISLHVYGADIAALGSSIQQIYGPETVRD